MATSAKLADAGPGFIFSPYKDTGISLNWNTYVISTAVTGQLEPLVDAMPAGDNAVSLGFATGTCGSEGWAGASAAQMASNVQTLAKAGKNYIISTGGADGAFLCPSTSAFASFIAQYYTPNMIGVDFDIEAGQTQDQIDSLVKDAAYAETLYPNMRFSFTVATLGANETPSLNEYGINVISSIKAEKLAGNYTVNLMTMDYGSNVNCVVGSNGCDMGRSAVQAAEDLNAQYGVPYNHIELTPMIGGNDSMSETFTLADVDTIVAFAKQNNLAGLHFWSFDRDKDCPPGWSQPTCNTYGQAGTLGFLNRFISDLNL